MRRFKSEGDAAIDAIDRLIKLYAAAGFSGVVALSTAKEWVASAVEEHRMLREDDAAIARAYRRGRAKADREIRKAAKR